MTVLAPMREEVFAQFAERSIADYAEENIASGRWPAEGALERSKAEFRKHLPQGLATPNHYLFEIKADDEGSTVGYLWFAAEERHGIRGAFVYDVVIAEAYRRRGHATAAFLALESIVTGMGLSTIGLHVFGHNEAAQALYRRLGFAVTGISMVKKLS
jgi:ribosomal protein S18 acetylase RimI-like enzyme